MFNIHIEGDVRDNKITFNPDRKHAKKLLDEIVSSLLTIQARKHTFKTENEKNDALVDSLRDKGFYVTDQSRQGRSGTAKAANYDSGELDLVIRDPDNNGTVISILEAFELDSLGEKNTIVKSHIDKLLNRYDTAGNKDNFIIVYAKAKYFDRLWKKYKKFVIQFIFPEEPNIEDLKISKSDLKVGMNLYNRSGQDLKLYHLFVNMYCGD